MHQTTFSIDRSTPNPLPKDLISPYVKELVERRLAWQEEMITHLLKPWQRWLITRTESPLLARLTGIEQRSIHNQDASTTIEIWQRGHLKARSVWRFTHD